MLNFKQTAKPSNYKPSPVNSRDRLVVRTLRCGRSNPGSNPGHGIQKQLFCGGNGDYMVQIHVSQNILSP